VDHVATARVSRFLSRAEAEIARGVLETNGVPAVVIGDDAGGAHPAGSYGYGGVALGVHPDDVEEAEALLGDIDPPIARRDLRSAGWRPRAVTIVATGLVVLLVYTYLEVFAISVLG
jgi:hypothetical protein